jgi:histidinol-phosphate aminotransferase
VSASPRTGLRDVAAYASPQPDVPVRLNTNECPYPLPPGFVDDLARAVADLPLHRYPDGQATELRTCLARRAGFAVDGTWAANGSNEVITELLLAYGGPGRTAMTFEPTYLLHARLAWLTHTAHVSATMTPPWTLGREHLDAARGLRPDVVFVCSPNNPTGTAQPLDVIDELAASLPGSLVIVDEAYVEFGGATAQPLLASRPNLVIVRTFSKAFALAGARIGYCLAVPDVVADVQRVRLPYHLSSLAQAAGLVALRYGNEAMEILAAVRRQRDRLEASLEAIPMLEAYPSMANFVLFRPPGAHRARDVWRALLERGVLVRDMTEIVAEGLRVTAGTEREIDAFLEAIEDVVA